MQIIDGQKIADQILINCKNRLINKDIQPILAIILIGNNPASLTYVQKKEAAGKLAGINVKTYKFETAQTTEILKLIDELNNDASVYGIILQLPAPGVDQYELCRAIDIKKDVDGLHPQNFADLWLTSGVKMIPATVKAIYYAIKFVAENSQSTFSEFITGKNVLIINRSSIIGKPLAGFLLNFNATVTLAHSKTQNLEMLISQADILVSGTGKQDFIKNQNFKSNAILIDVGFNKDNNRIFGDINRQSTSNSLGWLTPVPGGIGPIGVACLIENVVEGYLN